MVNIKTTREIYSDHITSGCPHGDQAAVEKSRRTLWVLHEDYMELLKELRSLKQHTFALETEKNASL